MTTKPRDMVPKRSPQVVHSLLAELFEGKDVVEIGTRIGDGFLCWAAATRSATAFEVERRYCGELSKHLQGYPGNTTVVCKSFFNTGADADVVTWWNQPPGLINEDVLDRLKEQQEAKALRDDAIAMPLFELGHSHDKLNFELLRNVSRAHWIVPYNEVKACMNKTIFIPGARHLCPRAKGDFAVMEIPVADWRPEFRKKTKTAAAAPGRRLRGLPVQQSSTEEDEARGRRLRAFFNNGTWGASSRNVTSSMLDASLFGQVPPIDALRATAGGPQQDCCVRILVVGGSTACGGGEVGGTRSGMRFPTTRGATAAKGPSGAWPANLQKALNNATNGAAGCCPGGHKVENVCRDAVDTQFFCMGFETHVQARHRQRRLHLILVDTAPNDLNVYHYARAAKMTERTKSDRKKETQLYTEIFLRKVASLPQPPAVAFVETAWFEHTKGMVPGKDDELAFGAWASHRETCEHYGVPLINMPRALAQHGLPVTRGSMLPLSRAQLYVDGLHLSAGGHWVQALFVAWALLQRATGGSSDSGLHHQLPKPLTPESELVPLMAKGRTKLDFTSPTMALEALKSLTSVSGWSWRLAKKVDGQYTFRDALSALNNASAEDRAAFQHKKLGLSAAWATDGAAAFTVPSLRVRLGQLRIGWLASYEGRANVAIELTSATGVTLNRVLNGTWERQISVFTSTTFNVREMFCPAPEASTATEACPALANGEDGVVTARFTLLPNAAGAGDFTVLSIYSY